MPWHSHTFAVARGWRHDVAIEWIVGLVVSVALLVYLTMALLYPERF